MYFTFPSPTQLPTFLSYLTTSPANNCPIGVVDLYTAGGPLLILVSGDVPERTKSPVTSKME